MASDRVEGSVTARGASVVRARGVAFSYPGGPPVLEELDLELGVGEIVALVGPRGSGKSTLLQLLGGELTPSAGVLELPARRSSGGRLMLGYAAAGPHFETLSGHHNALFFARAAGLRKREAEATVAEHMSLLGLEARRDRRVADYSLGERRKLLLVEALAHRPPLTLLDEPFHGLDRQAQEALIHLLRLHSAKRGTVVVASPKLQILPELADRILFLHEGRVVRAGRVAELLSWVGPATRIEIALDRAPQHVEARFMPGISVVANGGDHIILESTRGAAVVGEACSALIAAGAVIGSVKVRETDLAEAYRRATGVELDR
ncbi:MAG TPA: ABC transporter ATP-binding protein [Longimicrobiales bacterium]|nr:ABC transporter ATP-binding protein [Longimicrobiales bacterium]